MTRFHDTRPTSLPSLLLTTLQSQRGGKAATRAASLPRGRGDTGSGTAGAVDEVLVLDGDALGHVVDLVDADQAGRKLEHVVAQRDDDELGVLGTLLDVVGHDGHLLFLVRVSCMSYIRFDDDDLHCVAPVRKGAEKNRVLTLRKSSAASISSMTYSGVGL